MKNQNRLIFALDIGTRTIVGLVMQYNEPEYKIIASKVIEHENRAMLDGQIHDVNEVAKQVRKVKEALEKELGIQLKNVSIAAAGRALETITIKNSMELKGSNIIDNENVRTLEFLAVQKAKDKLADNAQRDNIKYNFVGYSVIEYCLDGVFLRNLVGQKGQLMEAKLVVTFLPRIVIDSLLSVINKVNLEVEYLTLEPIAAADVVIPHNMLSFNLALVDIGAGTSDIALTRGGSMIGYDMVPVAGDEITEILAEHYLLSYESAEMVKQLLKQKDEIKVKTILDREIVISAKDALNIIKPQVEKMVTLITEKIININGKSPQAVLCIGGGSLTPLLIDELTRQMELPEDRIGVKDSKDLRNICGEIDGINSTQSLTPIGIAVNSHKNKEGTNFYNVKVNDNSLQIFSIKQPTVSEALLAANVDIKAIRPVTGKGMTCTVNGQLKTVKGTPGRPGSVFLNGEKVGLDKIICSGDEIKFEFGEKGKNARAQIVDVIPEEALISRKININGENMEIKPDIFQNNKTVDLHSLVIDGSEIVYKPINTIGDAVAQLLEIPVEKINNNNIKYTLNGQEREISKSNYLIREDDRLVNMARPIEDGMKLKIAESSKSDVTINELLPAISEIISLKFNNNQLDIPCKKSLIQVNGEQAKKNYKIKDGDQIDVKFLKNNVNDVFKYINYNLSPAVKEKVTLKINDVPADFKDYVNDGDKIDLEFGKFNDIS